jgi:hypothetical protein
VNADLLNRGKYERFAQLLDDAEGIRRHHAVDEELADMVDVSHALAAATPHVHIREEFRTSTRAFLMATAEREGIGRTAVREGAVGRATVGAAAPSRSSRVLPRQLRPTPKQRVTTRRGRTRAAILVGLAVGTLALSGISAASGGALPGDALYSVKRQAENTQLTFAGSASGKGQLYLQFAQRRLSEAESVRGNDKLFTGAIADMDAQMTAGAKLLFTDSVKHHDAGDLQIVNQFVSNEYNEVNQLKSATDGAAVHNSVVNLWGDLLTIQDRSAKLKAAFACGATVPVAADKFGPSLACKESTTVTPNSTGTSKPTSKGTAKPSNGKTGTQPNGTTTTPASTPSGQSGTNNDAGTATSTGTTSSDSNGGLLDDIGRLLAGL